MVRRLALALALAAAASQVAAGADLCDETGWLFLVSTGRAGSTTALAMLNAVPGAFVSGEHGNSPRHGPGPFHLFVRQVREAAAGRALAAVSAFYRPPVGRGKTPALESVKTAAARAEAAAGAATVRAAAQQYLRGALSLGDGSVKANYLGTKELFGQPGRLELEDLDYLSALFPCARFVINYRHDVEKQARSGFHAEDKDGVLQNNTELLLEWAQHHRGRCFDLPLEDFSVPTFDRLLAFLGRGLQACRFGNLVHTNNYNGTGYSPGDTRQVEVNCTSFA